MATAEIKLLTAEEFSRLPNPLDGSKQELVKGVVVTMPPPGFRHGKCQVKIAVKLEAYAQSIRPGQVTVESGVITETGPPTVRGPDVSYWSHERLPPSDEPVVYSYVAPDLVVEVLSPNDADKHLTKKVREYFTMGVRLVWVVEPLTRTVTIYRQPGEGRVLWEDGTIDGEDVLPGFRCRVAEFFE
jgi:Uma2 family endonuclease